MPLFNNSARGMVTGKPIYSNFNPGITNAYKSALQTNAGDYDEIKQGYRNMMSNFARPQPRQYNSLTPTFRNYMDGGASSSGITGYQSDPGYAQSIAELSEFAKTGGYSDADIQNLRARGVGPIRSAYATALKESNRQKALSGGYAPNQGAVLAKFAREKGNLLSDQLTDINAGIAERVAQNKLASLQSLSALQAAENARKNEYNSKINSDKMRVDEYNTNLINEINQRNRDEQARTDAFNAAEEQRYLDNQNRALSGMSSIYSATPGLVSTFGNQVLSDRNQQLVNNSQRASMGLNLISQLGRPRLG